MNRPDLTNVPWRKSRRGAESGSCVELGRVNGMIAVRDSKNPRGPAHIFSQATWRAFTNHLK